MGPFSEKPFLSRTFCFFAIPCASIVDFDEVSDGDVRHNIKEYIDQYITALKPNDVKHRNVLL